MRKVLCLICVFAFIGIAFCDTKQCNQVLNNYFAKKSYSLKKQESLRRELDTFIIKGEYSRELKEEFESDFSTWYGLLMKCYSVPEIITALERQYEDDTPFLAKYLANADMFMPSIRKIKTIGIVYHKYFDGGVEKVISLHLPMFLKMGYSVVLIVKKSNPEKEYPLPPGVKKVVIPADYSSSRAFAFVDVLIENNIDVVVYHAAGNAMLMYDTLVAKSLKISVVVMRHELATQHMMSFHNQWKCNYHYLIYRLADKFLVLTTMDKSFFTLMGCDTKLVHNPIEFKAVEEDYNKNKGYILWIGRMDAYQKNYLDSVKIMKRVVMQRPDAKMVILGGSRHDTKDLLSSIKQNGLEKSITWVPYTLNVSEYYRGAKIHLLTSSCESSPMVIAESKSYAIPLVTYDLPYLEILKNKKGYIAVEQGDIRAAADAIVELLNNQTLCDKMSREAKESIQEYGRFSIEQEWSEIFNGLEHERKPMQFRQSEQEKELKLFFESLFFHYKKHFTFKNTYSSVILLVSCILFVLILILLVYILWKCIVQKKKLE